jgi:hypothetical protein
MHNTSNSYSRSPDSRISGMRSLHSGEASKSSVKQVQLKDEWEHFTVRFSIYSSSIKDENTELMRIIGSVPELTRSGTVTSGPLKLKRPRKKFRWLYDKYGQEMRPWEANIKMKVDKIENNKEIIYSYSKSDSNLRDFIYEREPSRIMEL